MTEKKKNKIDGVLKLLDEVYGPGRCYLKYAQPWHLLIATILSAQCTDKTVNIVTEKLFEKYPTVKALAEADISQLENDIHATGFYHSKARNIKLCAQKLVSEYGGVVPRDIDKLTSLPGVGRKTANVVRGEIFGIPSVVVDTHVKRISKLLGITESDDPVKAEFELMKVLPKDHWISYNIQVIAHGRKICIARRPKCKECFLSEFCDGKKTE